LYKANLRGARSEWLALVEEVEGKKTSALETLKFLLSRLINAASDFSNEADSLLSQANNHITKCVNRRATISILVRHLEKSDYAARLLEINMHALMQAAVESGAFGDMEVKPLSQMRSANKKHGNIGDIELLEAGQIAEAWDAKYGKGYLREEIEEAVEKFQDHDNVRTVGFVTTSEIDRAGEIQKRIEEIEELYSISLKVLSYRNWVDLIYKRVLTSEMMSETDLSQNWFSTYCNYLAQKRRDVAPIDEPCLVWVKSLQQIIREFA
jgi:predicted hydrocarbon binding protein